VDSGDLIERVTASGLRGRGGGWFPAGRKWRAVRVEAGRPLVVANGAEGEPGSIKDRHVMTVRTREVLRGLALAASAVGATEAVLFLKRSFHRSAEALARALAEKPPDGLSVTIRHGDDSYITGEETALLESLEGRRPWPRPKPPLPAAVGYLGRPTLVQNVETLARVPGAIEDPVGFRVGETTFVTVWGHVRRPGVYEVRLGTPIRQVIERADGPSDGIGMVFPAGPSAAPLRADQIDVPLAPEPLRALGSGLGTASILVVGASHCPLAMAVSLAAFFERESCGQCPPCVVGSGNLARIVRAVEGGAARGRDLESLAEAAGFMKDHGYCAHSRTAAGSVTGLLARFPEEVRSHLESRGCPHGGRPVDPFRPESPERTAVEGGAS
jgi:NADH-quinone oxidoreductase subunit F